MNYELVTLTSVNRDSLLSATLETIRKRQAEAPAILARLRELNPELAQHFQVKQNALSNLTLRMLCGQSPADGTFSSYIVISYCWRSAEWLPAPAAQPIFHGWEISEPMVDAILNLPGLRTGPEEGIWLDQLCINQADETEKLVAIGAMDVIYRSARRVIILLEDVQLDADAQAAGEMYAGFYADMCAVVKARNLEGAEKSDFVDSYFPAHEAALMIPQSGEDEAATEGKKKVKAFQTTALRFCKCILGARWFGRAWCAHESRIVPHSKTDNPLFLCFGHDCSILSFEFRFVHYLALYLVSAEVEPAPVEATEQSFKYFNDPIPQTLYQRWSRIQRLMGRPHDPNVPLTQHMVSLLPFRCLKNRDMVSIAMNTAGIPLTYTGNIEHRGDFVWVFSAVAIAAGDIIPLLLVGRKLRIPVFQGSGGERKNVVSWIADPVSGIVDDRQPSSLTESITAVTREYIELDLFVMTGRPLMASEASMEKASALLTVLTGAQSEGELPQADAPIAKIVELMRSSVEKAAGHRPTHLLKDFTQVMLAQSIDCGIDWISRFPGMVLASTDGEEPWTYGPLGAERNDRYAATAVEILTHFSLTENDDRYREYMDSTIRFLTCIMDDRMKFLTLMPRRLQTGIDDWGITAAMSNRSWLAVPVALATQPLWKKKRAWVVEPFDPDADSERPEDHLSISTSDGPDQRLPRDEKRVTWRLRCEEPLFGCQSIVANTGSPVLLLKRQKVYGSENYDWAAIKKALEAAEAKQI